jgi:hypothetical protein
MRLRSAGQMAEPKYRGERAKTEALAARPDPQKQDEHIGATKQQVASQTCPPTRCLAKCNSRAMEAMRALSEASSLCTV